MKERMLIHFVYAHLPPAYAEVSKPWCELAAHVVNTIPPGAERTVALRKLLEGKDCAVRAYREAKIMGTAPAGD